MAEEISASIIAQGRESLVGFIGRQFGYLIHYNENIDNLKNQVEKLEGLRNGVQGSIRAAKRKREEIRDEVENWITRVDGVMVEAKRFLEDDANANKRRLLGWFPDLTSRYRLSKEAKRKTITVSELEEDGKFHSISNPAPPPGIEFMSSGDFVAFETTKLAMAKVMEAMKEDKINFIGIYGMGGVGKTTLVKEIAKKAKEDKLFNNVVMAVVSETVDLRKIQDQIADLLGLRFNEQSDLGRSGQLHARLKDEKRILVILDDVWARLDVKAVGIPFGFDHEGCKMIITTRREPVCSTMGMGSQTTKIIHMDVLSEQESWDLFGRNAGDVINSPMLTAVAKEVASECKGLPIALVTVGRAMRDKDLEQWKEAARELKKSMPANIEGVDQDVYRCLKLSYDYLTNDEAKSCFLLCSLFPEDWNIQIEDLVRYGMGLGIFKNVDTINEARHRAHLLINNLKASCLLLAGDWEGSIKMHDVVRDVALSIGSDKYLVRAGVNLKEWPKVETMERYTGISLINNQIRDYPNACECPNLQILLMRGNELDPQMPGVVFEGMKALKVLDLSYSSSNRRLEPSFSHLKNLRTLIVEDRIITDTTSLGELKTLEILSFAFCEFQESTDAMRHLTNLRLLDLMYCSHSSHIPAILPPGVISSLSRLEELYMHGAVSSWASEGSSGNLPSIAELKSLPHLTIVTMCINDVICIPEDFVCPEIFKISVGPNCFQFKSGNQNCLGICGDTQCGEVLQTRSLNFVKTLFRRINHLSLTMLVGLNNVIPDLLPDGDSLNVLQELEKLEVTNCEALEQIFDLELEGPLVEEKELLCSLRELTLEDLPALKHIWKGPTGQVILRNLQAVNIHECSKLKILFQPAITQNLEKLKDLQVSACDELEEIIGKEWEEGEEAVDKMVFPQLKTLKLNQLSNLSYFSKGSFSFEWPFLERVEMCGCPKLKITSIVPTNRTQCTPKLKELKVGFCSKLSKSFELLELLQRLQELEIVEVKEWEAVELIFDLEIKGPLVEEKEVLASFSQVDLKNLHELKHIWKGPTGQVILHNLQVVKIHGCNKLKNLFRPAIARRLEKLKELHVSECDDLEEIVSKEQEEGEEAVDKLVFPQLKMLKLDQLSNLNGFCMGNFSFDWPSLESVKVSCCPKMKTFTTAVVVDGTQITPKLKELELDSCPKLSNSFPLLEFVQALQLSGVLRVQNCEAVDHIFDLELEGPLVEEKEVLASFRELDLRYLHDLKHIWKGPTGQVTLHNLQVVNIHRCNKLKNLFPPAIARRLQKLEGLVVYECYELEEIVATEQEGQEEGDEAINKVVFPQLKRLDLCRLSNLNGFCMGSFSFGWPSLESVKVTKCPKMKTFTTAVVAGRTQSTPKLKTIEVDGDNIDGPDINTVIQKRFLNQKGKTS